MRTEVASAVAAALQLEPSQQEKTRLARITGYNETQMAADIAEPEKKYIVYGGGKVQVYQPKIDQVTEYNPGKNRSDLESFLVLGFGGSGADLLKSYDVKYQGT